MKLYEEFKLFENMWDATANLTEDANSTDIDYSILTDTLNDALEFAATDPGQRNNVLVYAAPGTDVFAECKKWAATNGINLVYIKTPTTNYEELASDKFTTAKTVLFFEDFDQAGAESKAAVVSLLDSVYFDGHKNILFSIADCSIDNTLSTHEQNAFTFDILLEGCVNKVQIENKFTSLTESTTIYTDDGKIAAKFYSANESVQDYVDEVGPHEGGYTLIKTFWLLTNRGKLNVGLISLDETGGEEGIVCIPSYDVQFIAPFDEAEDVYNMLYESEPFDDIDAFIAKFVCCSYARSVERLLDSGVGHLTEDITNKVLTWTCFFDDKEIGTVEAANEEEAKEKMMDKYPEYQYSLYDGCFWVEPEDDASLAESSLTPEEKVDAWHNGTRRENYKAAGIPKLNTFRAIAVRKGYDELVKIIDDELAKRGSSSTTPMAAAPTPTVASTSSTVNSPTATSSKPVTSTEDTAEVPATEEPKSEASDIAAEPAHFSDELVADTGYITLSDKERDALIGMAITFLGNSVVYVRSHWSNASGFIGSYTPKCFNQNYNEIKVDKAIDRVRDLSYSSDKLMVLKSEIEGGAYNIDRYYSIDIPASTKFILDRDNINDMMWHLYKYYDSELDWRISVLTKTKANRKKFKQFLLDKVPEMPDAQAEELTSYAFDKL